MEIGERPCSSETKYKSIIAFGKAFIIDDNEEKKNALNIILDHYSAKGSYEYRDKQVNNVYILEIKLEEITGKKSGYEWPTIEKNI